MYSEAWVMATSDASSYMGYKMMAKSCHSFLIVLHRIEWKDVSEIESPVVNNI